MKSNSGSRGRSQHHQKSLFWLSIASAWLTQVAACSPPPDVKGPGPVVTNSAPQMGPGPVAAPATCQRIVHADVVALDQPIMFNRMGAVEPGGMIYALASDVVISEGLAGLGNPNAI